MTRLLLDENFPAPAARRLAASDVDVLAIRDASLSRRFTSAGSLFSRAKKNE